MTRHLGTNGGDKAHSCHVCTANGFDFLYVLVAPLIHELQNIHSNKHTMKQISQRPISISYFKRGKKKRKKKSPSHLVKVGDDLIE